MATILNVDDNEANRYVKSRLLSGAGFEVLESGTGQGALDLANTKHPDLVLLDIRLPDMTGFDVCRTLRAGQRTAHIPIVHISATHVGPVNEAESMEAGADIYLGEPVDPKQLLSAIRALLRLRATEQGLAVSEERMRLAIEGAGIATWDVVVDTGALAASEQLWRMLGYTAPVPEPTFDAWLQHVRPGERPEVAEAFREACERGKPFVLEHRVMLAGGEDRWIAPYGKLHVDALGMRRLVGVATDATDRRRADLERESLLRDARTAQQLAEEAVRMKDEFLAILSHEMRTPMSAVLGWLHLLKSGKLTPEQHATALETIERNARAQTQVVNDLLDVSRIVTGKMDVEMAVVPLDHAIERALDGSRAAAAQRSVELVPHLARGTWNVRGNAERLEQVIGNLLSNAVKFSPEGGKVDVRLQRAGPSARVSVVDRGEGIPPDVLPHVFDRFRQADSSTQRRHGGLGLGLAIVKALVDAHGGTIEVESAGEGRGATFSVMLPLLAEGAAQPAVAAAAVARDSPVLSGVRVLVVDDDEAILDVVAQALRLEGASVMTSVDAPSALGIARGWQPDALLLDIGLPQKDGYALLPELRAVLAKDARQLPAIAVTGLASGDAAARALAAGFQAHVAKPVAMDALCQLVCQLVRGR